MRVRVRVRGAALSVLPEPGAGSREPGAAARSREPGAAAGSPQPAAGSPEPAVRSHEARKAGPGDRHAVVTNQWAGRSRAILRPPPRGEPQAVARSPARSPFPRSAVRRAVGERSYTRLGGAVVRRAGDGGPGVEAVVTPVTRAEETAEVPGVLPESLTHFIGYLLRRVYAQFSASGASGESDSRDFLVLDALTGHDWESQLDL